MRKVLLLTVAALLVAAPALAISPDVVKQGKFLIVTCTSPDTLAANTADNFDFILKDKLWLVPTNTDDTAANMTWVLPLLIGNTSSTAADSVNIYVHSSLDGSNWESVIAVGNDNFALNGAEEKQVRISGELVGPWVRIGVKAVGSNTTARAVKLGIPLE